LGYTKLSLYIAVNQHNNTMENLNHTQGPWEIDQTGLAPKICVHKDNVIDRQNIATIHGKMYRPEDSANTKLIVSSPELLKSLMEMVENFSPIIDSRDEIEQEQIIKRAQDIIKKATN